MSRIATTTILRSELPSGLRTPPPPFDHQLSSGNDTRTKGTTEDSRVTWSVEFLTTYFQGICDGTTQLQLSSAQFTSNQLIRRHQKIHQKFYALSHYPPVRRQTDSLLQSSAACDDYDDDDDDIDDPRPVLLTNLSKPAKQQIRTRIATTDLSSVVLSPPQPQMKNNTSR